MQTLYFDVHHAINEHDKIIAISGGLLGILDEGKIESVLVHIQNDEYYPNIDEKLTHLVFSFAMSHAFVDGNKRSSIALGAYFLEINSYPSLINQFIIEMENIVLWVAKKFINKKLLQRIISCIILNGKLTEEVKLEIYSLLNEEERSRIKESS